MGPKETGCGDIRRLDRAQWGRGFGIWCVGFGTLLTREFASIHN